jgi:hypothetical protein
VNAIRLLLAIWCDYPHVWTAAFMTLFGPGALLLGLASWARGLRGAR